MLENPREALALRLTYVITRSICLTDGFYILYTIYSDIHQLEPLGNRLALQIYVLNGNFSKMPQNMSLAQCWPYRSGLIVSTDHWSFLENEWKYNHIISVCFSALLEVSSIWDFKGNSRVCVQLFSHDIVLGGPTCAFYGYLNEIFD